MAPCKTSCGSLSKKMRQGKSCRLVDLDAAVLVLVGPASLACGEKDANALHGASHRVGGSAKPTLDGNATRPTGILPRVKSRDPPPPPGEQAGHLRSQPVARAVPVHAVLTFGCTPRGATGRMTHGYREGCPGRSRRASPGACLAALALCLFPLSSSAEAKLTGLGAGGFERGRRGREMMKPQIRSAWCLLIASWWLVAAVATAQTGSFWIGGWTPATRGTPSSACGAPITRWATPRHTCSATTSWTPVRLPLYPVRGWICALLRSGDET